MRLKLLKLAAKKCGSMIEAEGLRIGRFNVKYILKLALVAVIPALLVVGAASAAQHHRHKAGHRAHHRSSHHAHSATRHKNPN
jgi:hypothetical protein